MNDKDFQSYDSFDEALEVVRRWHKEEMERDYA